jgi:hypothetical protein
MKTPLGLELQVSGFAVVGEPSEEASKILLQNIVNYIGMSTGGMKPAVWTYPIEAGQGGTGHTLVQPYLTLQPLVESLSAAFTAIDQWTDHNGFYLIICSCRCFSSDSVKEFLEHLNYKVINKQEFILSLEGKR